MKLTITISNTDPGSEGNMVIGVIDVPERAKCINYAFHDDFGCLDYKQIPLPRPMKKVWKWETDWGDNHLISDHSHFPPVPLYNGCHWSMIVGSEKEIEG